MSLVYRRAAAILRQVSVEQLAAMPTARFPQVHHSPWPPLLQAAIQHTHAVAVFHDAQAFIAEYDHPYAVAIRGDRIIAVGALGSVERIAGPTARKVPRRLMWQAAKPIHM